MALTFARSAKRHGISHERAAYVIEHCAAPFYDDDGTEGSEVALYLGLDWNGIPLEIGAVVQSETDLRVIHAMPMRGEYVSAFAAMMRWHER